MANSQSINTFRTWDIVVVPFPFTDSNTRKVRPAVIVSSDVLAQRNGKYVVAMITSAVNAPQYGDVTISDLALTGLPTASVMRVSKLATVETQDILKSVGVLGQKDQANLARQLREFLTEH